MSIPVRIVLLIGAIGMLLYVARGVRKAKFKAQETFFWLFLTFVFVLLSIFPGVAETFAMLLGVASPANLVYLVVIFLLLFKLFTMDRKIAKIEHQMVELVQRLAIDKLDDQQKRNTNVL